MRTAHHNMLNRVVLPLAAVGVLGGIATHFSGGCGDGKIVPNGIVTDLGVKGKDKIEVSSQSAIDSIEPKGDFLLAQSDGENTTEISAQVHLNLGLFGFNVPETRKTAWVQTHESVQLVLRGDGKDLKLRPYTVGKREGIAANVTINPNPKDEQSATIYSQRVNPVTLASGGSAQLFGLPTIKGTTERASAVTDYSEFSEQASCANQTRPALALGVRKVVQALEQATANTNADSKDPLKQAKAAKLKQLGALPVQVHFWLNGREILPNQVPLQPIVVASNSVLGKVLGKQNKNIFGSSVKANNQQGAQVCTPNAAALQKSIDMMLQSSQQVGAKPGV